jgi:hypothetical protein
MNSFRLPENPGDWPANPFVLLGVDPSASKDAVRRAYTNLIRRYKPEQFPQEFQRIRAAYDAIRGRGTPLVRIADPFAPAPEMRREECHPARAAAPGRLRLALAEAAWGAARSGDAKGAYRQLVELQRADPSDEEIYVRLFWLSALFAEVDPERRPSDWLLAGLQRAGTPGRLRELWELEVRSAPRLAMTEEYRQLIGDDTRPVSTCDLLRIRWEAAWLIQEDSDRLDYHDWILEGDVASLRHSPISQRPDLWTQVLQMAVERLAWTAAPGGWRVRDPLLHEIDQLVRVREANLSGMHEFDLALAAARDAMRLKGNYHAHWVKSIRAASLSPVGEVDAIIRPLLDEMAADPQAALARLDYLRRQASTLLWKVNELVSRIAASSRHQNKSDQDPSPTPAIVDFLLRSRQHTYRAWRPKLLDFLISEDLLPDLVAALLEKGDIADAKTRILAAKLREDVPLHCVCAACCQLWTDADP